VVKIKIENTERTSGAQHGETISVYCFQRKPSLLPIATEGGHKAVPKEGQRIRALVKTRHNRLEGIYPDWFHVLDLNAKELEATKWVRQMRGDLLCDDEHPGRPIASLILTRIRISSINDTGLKHLAAFQSLRSLDIRFEKITDEGLRDVAALTGLEELKLDGVGVGDKGIQNLKPLNSLRELRLVGTRVTDTGLRHLSENHSSLRSLTVSGEKITDAGLRELARLTGLRELLLQDTKATGKGLLRLTPCRNLRSVECHGVTVTDQQRRQLKEAMPGCEFRNIRIE
jgi:hypothetical protein